jgi:hypothetical protein
MAVVKKDKTKIAAFTEYVQSLIDTNTFPSEPISGPVLAKQAGIVFGSKAAAGNILTSQFTRGTHPPLRCSIKWPRLYSIVAEEDREVPEAFALWPIERQFLTSGEPRICIGHGLSEQRAASYP